MTNVSNTHAHNSQIASRDSPATNSEGANAKEEANSWMVCAARCCEQMASFDGGAGNDGGVRDSSIESLSSHSPPHPRHEDGGAHAPATQQDSLPLRYDQGERGEREKRGAGDGSPGGLCFDARQARGRERSAAQPWRGVHDFHVGYGEVSKRKSSSPDSYSRDLSRKDIPSAQRSEVVTVEGVRTWRDWLDTFRY